VKEKPTRDIATATLSGNLTRDVELRELPSGVEVARLRVATTTRRRNGEEWVDKTNYLVPELRIWRELQGSAGTVPRSCIRSAADLTDAMAASLTSRVRQRAPAVANA
jgi:hypothetical protein